MKLTNDNYVELAEKTIGVMKAEKERNFRTELVSTTKIRGLLAMLADIYNEIQDMPDEVMNEHIRSRIDYLRIRFVYEAGKEETVKKFVNDANLLDYLKAINGKRSEFILFYHYMEALVAYFKFNGLDKKER